MLQSHTSWAQQHHHVAVVTSITPNNGNPINLQSKEICPNTKLLLRGKEREKKQNISPLSKNCHTRQKKATEKNSGKHVTVSPKKKNEENIIACGWGKTFFSTDFFFLSVFRFVFFWSKCECDDRWRRVQRLHSTKSRDFVLQGMHTQKKTAATTFPSFFPAGLFLAHSRKGRIPSGGHRPKSGETRTHKAKKNEKKKSNLISVGCHVGWLLSVSIY